MHSSLENVLLNTIHYRHKLNNLIKELEKRNNIEQIGSSPENKPNSGTT